MVDLALDEEQEQLSKAYRGLLEHECDLEAVRASEVSGFSAPLWRRICELGGPDMALPEAVGGGGARYLDLVLVHEVLGAFLAPVPLAETATAGRLLAALQTGPAHEMLAELLASGQPFTLAPRPAAGGRLRFVPGGAVADVVIARDGDRIVAVRGDDPVPYPRNLGALPVADRALTNDAVTLAEGPAALTAFDDAVLEWRGLIAAQLVGAGRRALEIGVAYTKDRHAFGVPVASFQAVAHRLAEAAILLDGAQLLVRKAGWAADTSADRWRALLQMGFVVAEKAAVQTVDEVLHFHGGYGFMLEYDIQLYFRRVKAWSLQNGDPVKSLAGVADRLWGPAEPVPVA